MKRLLILTTLLSATAIAVAQTPTTTPPPSGSNTLTLPTLPDVLSRLSFTYATDLSGKGVDGKRRITNTQAALYRFTTIQGFLPTVLKGRFKTNVDLDAVLGAAGNGANLGFAGVLTGSWGIQYSATGKITLVPTVGPALLYNTTGQGMHLGLVLGLGFRL